MIVIDINIVSEMMRDEPDRRVLAWAETVGQLHTTAVTLAEIDDGIARLPHGRRKDRLMTTATRVFADFGDVVLPFDAPAARRYAGIVVGRESAGRPVTTGDAQIAAICASRGAALAQRRLRSLSGVAVRAALA